MTGTDDDCVKLCLDGHPEAYEQLGVPLGTVTKRLSRAYSMLRESLRRYERQQERSEVKP